MMKGLIAMLNVNRQIKQLLKIQESLGIVIDNIADENKNDDKYVLIVDQLLEMVEKIDEVCEDLIKTKRDIEL